ncbi:MAG: EamA family transporter [Nitrospinae bacterium]|nr:EamA family transporter [Nitrospinota bacterium]
MRYLIYATILFSFGPVLVRLGLAEGLDSNHLVVLRLAVAFPSFLLAVVVSGSLPKAGLKPREIPFVFLISVVGMGTAMTCFFRSVSILGASLASLLGAVTPVVTALLAYFFLSRPVTKRQATSMFASFLGVGFLTVPATGLLAFGKIDGASLGGVGYSLLATLCASGAALGFERYVINKSPLVAAFHVTGFMFVFFASLFGFPEGRFTPRIWEIILVLGIFTWFVPFMLFFYGIRELGASGAALIQNAGPLMTVLTARFLFGETLVPAQLVGMVLLISSVYVFALERKKLRENDLTLPEA